MAVAISSIPVTSWYAITYLVIVGSILSFMAYIYMLQQLPSEVSSIYAYINPIVAVLLGALLFGESLSVAIAIGGGITLFGLYMVNHSIRRTRRKALASKI
ncbi:MULTISPECIES: EamA family transporter [unclassified Flavobacterium]|uniref:EamA family transporter n=1 Tax=unclassified Flavobacterium TaxID=196869 RepID=UPI003F8DBA60